MKKLISILLILSMMLAMSSVCFAADTVSPFAVSEYNGGIVSSYSEAGTLVIQKEGKVYKLSDKYDYPTGLAADSEGNLYISETGLDRIVKLNKNGKATVYIENLNNPMGLCYAEGKLYIAETGSNRILVYDGEKLSVAAGLLVLDTDEEAVGDFADGTVSEARFAHPQGVAVTSEGVIYVADTDNHSIRKIENNEVSTVWDNRDLKDELTKPGNLRIIDNTLEIYDLFLKKTLTLTLGKTVIKFDDVKDSDWFSSYVKAGVEMQIVGGYGDGSFGPYDHVTRAQLACMLANIQLYYNPSTDIRGHNIFSDVPDGTWYTDQVCWAADFNIAQGYDGKFNPGADITRQDLVCMLYRYAKLLGHTASVEDKDYLSSFTDSNQVAGYAQEAVEWAVAVGLLNGSNGKLNPKGTASRAEAITILVRFINMN